MKNTLDIKRILQESWDNRRNNLRESFDTAIRFLQEAKENNLTKEIADSSKILGYCYWRFSDYSKSLNHSLNAIKLYKSLKDKKGEADTLNSLGAVYMFQNDNQKRLDCNLNCLKLREEILDFEGVSGSMNNIGETYFEMNDFDNAEKWLIDCLQYEHSGIDSKAWANHNLGKIEQVKKNTSKAKDYYLKCLELTSIDKYDVLTCETYIKLSELLLDNDLGEAENYGLKALELGKQIGAKEYIKEALLLLSYTMEKCNKNSEALNYHKEFHKIHEEIFNEENSQKIKDIGYKYEIDKISKEAEIERLKKVELAKAYNEIERKNLLIQQKNKDITDSIRYAKKIQQALLLPEEHVSKHLPEHFILFKPKDIVSGDFYWSVEKGDCLYIAVADCTGHGVPGAFLTVLGTSFLNEITNVQEILSPAEILDQLRSKFIKDIGTNETRDGMDISLLKINISSRQYQWAGAIRNLWVYKKEEKQINIIAGNKQSICFAEKLSPFTNISGVLDEGDIIYLHSDGYVDQFGGPKGKKFKRKKLLELITGLYKNSLIEQKKLLNEAFEKWKGDLEQIDDVCVIGIKI